MQNTFLAAAAMLVVSAASAWSQELSHAAPALFQTSAEQQSDAAEVLPGPLSETGAAPGCACDLSCCDSNNQGCGCGNGTRFWVGAEVLPWWIKQGHTPPLATSGTVASSGALGPGTTTLFGGDQDYNLRLGGRFTAGYWLNSGQTKGIEGSYFFLTGPADNFNANSNDLPGSMVLARPFFNPISGTQDSQLISFPGITSGAVGITSSSQLQGAQLNLICNLCCCRNSCCDCCQTNCWNSYGYRVDMITGFAYFGLRENLAITENLTFLPTAPSPPFVPGDTIAVADRFQTSNNFYGPQIGARAEWWRGRWLVNAVGRLALGDTNQQVRINGTTVFTDPSTGPVTQQGGLLALPTNIGAYQRNQFTVVPQINFNLGRQVTSNLRVYVGYSLLYWSSVARPGDQIDFNVNPTQLPTATGPGTLVGPARPAFTFQDTGFWAQGINIGLAITR